jgi:hypothetical protein
VYAGASQAGTIAVQTHPSIGWRDEQVTFAGPYVETPAP